MLREMKPLLTKGTCPLTQTGKIELTKLIMFYGNNGLASCNEESRRHWFFPLSTRPSQWLGRQVLGQLPNMIGPVWARSTWRTESWFSTPTQPVLTNWSCQVLSTTQSFIKRRESRWMASGSGQGQTSSSWRPTSCQGESQLKWSAALSTLIGAGVLSRSACLKGVRHALVLPV